MSVTHIDLSDRDPKEAAEIVKAHVDGQRLADLLTGVTMEYFNTKVGDMVHAGNATALAIAIPHIMSRFMGLD